MPTIVVVGGQYGSEGKGKTCAYLAEMNPAQVMVRCGGPNSGHTVIANDRPVIFRQLPAGALNTNCRLLLPAGSYILPGLLFNEIRENAIDPSRVGVDANAVVVCPSHVEREANSDLRQRIGSTLSGTGAAVASRIGRDDTVRLAKCLPELNGFLADVAEEISQARACGQTVIIEGTQGFGLSVYHSPFYPFATSRDTTASGFASEVGISPRDVDEIVMVIRAFPIRVGGNSGPLAHETSWQTVTGLARSPRDLLEYSSVTKRPRRVGEFDGAIVQRAIMVNNPSTIVLNHVDYVDWSVHGSSGETLLPRTIVEFVERVEREIQRSVDLIGTGPCTSSLVARSFSSKTVERTDVAVRV